MGLNVINGIGVYKDKANSGIGLAFVIFYLTDLLYKCRMNLNTTIVERGVQL